MSLSPRFIFTRQFAATLKGKLQLAAALGNLSAEVPNGKFRVILQSVLKDMSAGRDMAYSMREYPKIFEPIYVSVVCFGLRSCKIDEAMDQLS